MKNLIILLTLSIFLVSCSDNKEIEVNQENTNIEVTENKEKSESKEVEMNEVNEEKIVENKNYKCDIQITNIPGVNNPGIKDNPDLQVYINQDFSIKTNNISCKYMDSETYSIEDGYGEFYIDGTLVGVGGKNSKSTFQGCAYRQAEYIDMGEENKDLLTFLQVSKRCSNFKIWLTHKNISFSIFDIATENEAKRLANKLEKAVNSLKMESSIINTHGNYIIYEDSETNEITKVELQDFYLYEVCGEYSFGDCSVDSIENGKIYWSSSRQSRGYGEAKHYETNPLGVTRLIKEESWEPENY